MTTPNLALPHITASQSNKETTANLQADGLDKAMNNALNLSITGSRILTSALFRENHAFILHGSPGATFTLSIPANIDRFFGVLNYTNQTCLIEVASDRSGAVDIPAGEARVLVTNGNEVYLYGRETTVPYDIAAYVNGKPTDDEAVFFMVAPRAFRIGTGFTLSRARARVSSTGDVSFSIQVNDVPIGAVRFDASVTGSFSTAGGGPGLVSAGDRLAIIAPEYQDPTLSDISIVLAAIVE